MNYDYRQLTVWTKSMELTRIIYELTKLLPKEESFALVLQMRRAVVSIPSNIAEGHGRNSDKEFVNFLSIARGSLLEISTQLDICVMIEYIPKDEIVKAQSLIEEVWKMLNSLITYRKNKL